MKWFVFLLGGVCGLLLVHQIILSHRIQLLQQERDLARTDLQSQVEHTDPAHAASADAALTAGTTPADPSSVSTSSSSTPANASSAAAPARDSDRVQVLEKQVRDLTYATTTAPPKSRVPEYDPTAPATASFDPEPVGQEVATNSPAGRSWGPEQVIGPPDTDHSGDLPTAWATFDADGGGTEWLWVGFDRPTPLAEVRIRETFNPGAISKVTVRNGNQEIVLWEGSAAGGRAPRDFVVPVRENISAQSVVIYLESNRVAGWNEIDAVELVGRDGSRQWASSASASSTYADRTSVPVPVSR